MKKIKLFPILLLLFVYTFSCKEKTEDPKPENLVIDAVPSTDNSGLVTFTAKADNTIYYVYFFTSAPGEAPIKSTDGKGAYIYPASGTYTVTVQAHSSDTEFIKGTKQIVVTKTSPPSTKLENLALNMSPSTDGSGKVDFVATATNATSYDFVFGTYEFEPVTNSTNGTTSFTYLQGGTYNVTVKAKGANNQVLTLTKQVTIDRPLNDIGFTSPDTYEGMTKVWEEGFDGAALNLSDWNFETGTGSGGWGNKELQYYRTENTAVSGGFLTITAKKESFGGMQYTSSRMTTKGKKFFKYGRMDVRALLPKGQGIWPAIWMLGENINAVGWPQCGEIDIMEMVGGTGKDNVTHGTIHWQADGGYAKYGGSKSLTDDNFANKFHVFSVDWDAEKIVWYLDGVQFHVVDIKPTHLDEFRENFFFILNVAVGGNWPGSPNTTTIFPQKMVVDYVRVFQPN